MAVEARAAAPHRKGGKPYGMRSRAASAARAVSAAEPFASIRIASPGTGALERRQLAVLRTVVPLERLVRYIARRSEPDERLDEGVRIEVRVVAGFDGIRRINRCTEPGPAEMCHPGGGK
jgi:hypothetical protein